VRRGCSTAGRSSSSSASMPCQHQIKSRSRSRRWRRGRFRRMSASSLQVRNTLLALLQQHVRLFAAGPKHFTCFTGTSVQIVTEEERVVAEELRISAHHALFSRTSPLGIPSKPLNLSMSPHTSAYRCAHTGRCVVYCASACASRRIACENSSFRARHR
jgi:hypothetical protein